MSANGLGKEFKSEIYDPFLLQFLEEIANIVCDSRRIAGAISHLEFANNLLHGVLTVASFQNIPASAAQANGALGKE